MSNFTLKSLVAASFLLVGASGASAGTDAVRAEAFFNAISGGNAETVTSFYADKAEFHWVGGPLAGIYKGKGQIKGVWERFGQAAGKLDYKTLEVAESRNGPISTVTARVKFIGPKEVPVKFVLMFKDGKIVNQIWQVDRGEGYTAAKASQKAPEPEAQTGAQQAEAPKAEKPARVAATNEAEQAAAPPGEPEVAEIGAPEAPDGAPGPNPEQGEQQAAVQAPGGAPTPDEEAGAEPGAPPAGIGAPDGREPKKKIVKKFEKQAEKKKIYEPEYDDYDEDYGDYRGYRRYRGHYGYRWHGGHGYGHGYRSGYGRY